MRTGRAAFEPCCEVTGQLAAIAVLAVVVEPRVSRPGVPGDVVTMSCNRVDDVIIMSREYRCCDDKMSYEYGRRDHDDMYALIM